MTTPRERNHHAMDIARLSGAKLRTGCDRVDHAMNDVCDELGSLRDQVVYLRGSCGACGEKMTGEWCDGTELTCPECGVEVVAQIMTDGAWTFPQVFDDGDDS